ncbi:minor capsid protein [Streptococcus parasanguinis]|uniref:minor capsid protein n=1 Tax=Streptococcus parasanguinis TaxID=1318 RepID=UPI00352EB3CC
MTETVRQNSYWRNRVELEQKAAIKRDEDYATELKKMHDYYFNEIEKEIRTFINRYAEKNGNIPYSEVVARLDAMDVAAFAEKAKRYVEEKDFGALANRELAIYNLKMRVSRLEALQQELDLQMIALANEEEKKTGQFLKEEYLQGLKSQAGILGVSEGATVSTAMKQAIDRNFNGATWSSRIWDRQNALRDIVKKTTADLLVLGKNPTQIISKLRKEFGVSAHQAKRLAVTEGSRVAMAAQKDSLESQGYDEYEYIAEPSACKICAPLDGKIFKVENMESGRNCAPMHPFCRCSVAAHYSKVVKPVEKEIEKPKEIEEVPSVGTAFSYGLDLAHKTLQNFVDNTKKWYNSHIESRLSADDINASSEALKKVIDNSAYSMRFKYANIDKLIESGKFMNQFETGTSGGTLNTKYRRQATNQLFGLSGKRLKKSEFEKYGYFGNKDAIKDYTHNSTSWGGVGQYGDVIIHFAKDKVANKTTFTVNNSLGPAVYQELVADNPNRPNLVGIDKELLKETVDLLKAGNIKTPEEASKALGVRYLEAQYHGEIGISDISSMYFTNDKPSEKQIQSLKEFGINLYVKEGDQFVKIE